MKEKLLEEVGIFTSDLDHLFKQLINHQYAFAIWRIPNTDISYLLIDLKTEIASPNTSLEELHDCFVINPYKSNHPPKPHVLAGDIIVSYINNAPEISISPKVSAKDIEELSLNLASKTDTADPTDDSLETYTHDFSELVSQAIQEIKNGSANKIVLSRYEEFTLKPNFSLNKCFSELQSSYPNAFCYMCYTQEYGLWVGASPERLISIENRRYFKTESLAGTQYLPGIDNLSDVAWTQKEIEEQAMVSRYIIGCLKKIRLREFEESGPKTVRAGKLVHLKTEYKVDMVETNMPDLGSIMLELLHPTSAVCGTPFESARQFIEKHENYDRSLYAGFLGPVNFKDSTNLFVNLRCMQLFDSKARLYAGAGITEDSNPAKEYQETVNKMLTLRDLL
ncbi:MAG: chorismate-binding protein [Cyclobacteriaceae bacterium]|jgi:isochorismate synthase